MNKNGPLRLVVKHELMFEDAVRNGYAPLITAVIETYSCGHSDYYPFPYEPTVKRRCGQCSGEAGPGRYSSHYCRR